MCWPVECRPCSKWAKQTISRWEVLAVDKQDTCCSAGGQTSAVFSGQFSVGQQRAPLLFPTAARTCPAEKVHTKRPRPSATSPKSLKTPDRSFTGLWPALPRMCQQNRNFPNFTRRFSSLHLLFHSQWRHPNGMESDRRAQVTEHESPHLDLSLLFR